MSKGTKKYAPASKLAAESAAALIKNARAGKKVPPSAEWEILAASIQGVADVEGNMVVEIGWVARDQGFGVITLNNPRNQDRVEIDAETLGKQFVKNVLAKLVDDGKLIG